MSARTAENLFHPNDFRRGISTIPEGDTKAGGIRLRRDFAWDNRYVMSPTEYEQLVEFLGRKFGEIDRRFDQIDGQVGDLRRELLGHFDEIYRRLERVEQEYQAIIQGLRRIEARLSDESGRREILARDLAELKQQVTDLQSRIEDIEARLTR